ncbi:hypothetical protein DFQ29_005787 [Apophysomyces sp. BC1021]|nr:hypothetical protein DFQ29_005787 [Apophysomyces sp. BC1021]
MIAQYLYENGQGNVVDENPRSESMDHIVDQEELRDEDSRMREVTEQLMQQFDGLKVTHSTVYNFMSTECNLSVKQAGLQSLERNSPEMIEERHNWVRKWERKNMDYMTNWYSCCCNSANHESEDYKISKSVKKRKSGQEYGYMSTGIVTGYYTISLHILLSSIQLNNSGQLLRVKLSSVDCEGRETRLRVFILCEE